MGPNLLDYEVNRRRFNVKTRKKRVEVVPKSVPDRIDSSRQIELLARKAEELKA
jgi:hypothetical protein